jgi:hypothetical protein
MVSEGFRRETLPLADPESPEADELFVNTRQGQQLQEALERARRKTRQAQDFRRAEKAKVAPEQEPEPAARPPGQLSVSGPLTGGVSRASETEKAVVRDVAGGVSTAGGSVARGAEDFLTQSVLAANDFSRFMAEKTGVSLSTIAQTAATGVLPGKKQRQMALEAETALRERMETGLQNAMAGDERTHTGQLIRDTTSFMLGFLPLVGWLKKMQFAAKAGPVGGRVIRDMAAGGAADFVIADPTTGGILDDIVEFVRREEQTEENLANLITEHPDLQEPVEQFMAAEEGEAGERIKNRAKQALIGMGLGLLTDGFLEGLRMLRNARRARLDLDQRIADEGATREEIPPEDVQIDPDRPADRPLVSEAAEEAPRRRLVEEYDQVQHQAEATDEVIVGGQRQTVDIHERVLHEEGADTDAALEDAGFAEVARARQARTRRLSMTRLRAAERAIAARRPELTPEQIREAALEEAESPEFDINFDRIASDEDVVEVIDGIARMFRRRMHSARRGVRSNEVTQETADFLDVRLQDVVGLRRGQALNAEESLAFRRVWIASAEKLTELARLAQGDNATNVDLVRFRRMASPGGSSRRVEPKRLSPSRTCSRPMAGAA